VCGPEGAGKSTVAGILAKHGGSILPFAAPLKAMLRTLGVPDHNLYGTPADKLEPLELLGGKSARWAMQSLGTQWGRMCMDADFWVRAWAEHHDRGERARADAGMKHPRMVVADDVRFQSEVDEITRRGGLIILVVRSQEDFNREPQHASEDFAALRADVMIINDGNIEHLEADVLEALTYYGRVGAGAETQEAFGF
jgi:hypothetical protein